MAFLIGGANSAAADAGYNVANSCRFDGSNDYFTKTFGSDPTSTRIGTVSYWCKRSSFGASIAGGLTTSGNGSSYMTNFNSSDQIDFWFYYPGSGADYEGELKTNAVFRDPSAWMHVFFSYDTTQVTNTNRLKLYINGTQVTSLATATYPDQNQDVYWGTQTQHRIGANPDTGNNKWNGYMAEVAYVDGVAHAITDFGEFDEDSPTIWKPKDISSGITWGTNGFYLDFEDSSALGDDVSGNNNDWTATGIAAVDQTTDTPTNNFATLNPLHMIGAQSELSQGNLEWDPAAHHRIISTIAPTSGKWYAEVKGIDNPDKFNAGVCHYPIPANSSSSSFAFGDGVNADVGRWANDFGVKANGDYGTNNSWSSYMATLEGENNNIVGIYMDLDNYKIYLSKNGSLVSSTGKNLTNNSEPYGFISVGEAATFQWNFGQPSFALADTAITDDNGYGAFEYSPNITGDSEAKKFYALCTKNLAEFG